MPEIGLAPTERLREMRGSNRNTDLVRSLIENLFMAPMLMGFEGEGDKGASGDKGSNDSGGQSGGGNSSDDQQGSESEEGEDEDDDDLEGEGDKITTGLRAALKKERQQRRETQKQFKQLQKQITDGKTADDAKEEEKVRKAREEQDAATATKFERLATGYRNTAVDSALARALQDPKLPQFQDPDDVLRLVDRTDIDVDQDDDDPTDVVIDEEDIKRAIKKLAKRKPHLLKPKSESEGEGQGGSGEGQSGGNRTQTTGRFNGRPNGSTTAQQRDEELRRKYSALRSNR